MVRQAARQAIDFLDVASAKARIASANYEPGLPPAATRLRCDCLLERN